MLPILSLTLQHDQDVVTARQRAAQIAELLQFDPSDQTRIATAVSEIVRNAFRYTGGGSVQFDLDVAAQPQRFVVRVEDRGPGIENLDDVLGGRYQSQTGLGIGIPGARQLMDHFSIESSREGTRVRLDRSLPPRAGTLTAESAGRITAAARAWRPEGTVEDVQQQNQALLRALAELQRKQQELVHLNRELEDTNRGVVALYAELDEKADHLRRADELKSRFLSNMTHEFRTPVNAIIGLCNLLSEDRALEGREPQPEVHHIRQSAEQLSELVNDLLDITKVDAGKTVVRPVEFEVQNLFGALRGMLKPMLLNQSVALIFEEVDGLPALYTDEAKVSQILRNLISNALKYTERGEVRISAAANAAAGTVTFSVADTGIGIAAADQPRIFEEFAQLEHRLQRRVRGTGLGLPLSRRLAELLGGSLTVRSEPGAGSTFAVALPARYEPADARPTFHWTPDPAKLPLLVVEDAHDAQFLYERALRNSPFQVYPAYTSAQAIAALDRITPAAIVMDLVLSGAEAWDLLIHLKRDERTREVPVVIVSGRDQQAKGLALGAEAYLVKPLDRGALLDTLTAVHARMPAALRVLTIDDEDLARRIVRQCLPMPAFEVIEASSAAEGLDRARTERPDAILLDLVMPGTDGWTLLARLRADPLTCGIPVVIVSGATVEGEDARRLLEHASAILSKGDLSRHNLPDIVRRALQRAI